MRVLLVGPKPPPTGGIATHLRELQRAVGADWTDPRDRADFFARLTRARLRGDLLHVHINGHNRGAWTLAALGAGPRSILTIHSGLAPDYIDRHRLTRAIARSYRHVVAVNPEIARAIGTELVIPAWTARSLAFRLDPPGLRQLRARHEPLLACALAPGREYGAEILLDAFDAFVQKHPRAGLLLYGPGTRELASEVARRGVRQNVALFGELPRERALAIVAACDLFVRPTLADGDAVSVREALALGKIVVASAVGNRPAEALTFPAGSAAACAELLFHAADSLGVRPASQGEDGLATLLKVYECCGVHTHTATVGTGLAI
jgi:glycogen(starch) synthase